MEKHINDIKMQKNICLRAAFINSTHSRIIFSNSENDTKI